MVMNMFDSRNHTPNDISAANLVDSSRIANAEITYVGAGQVADTGKKGWLSNAMRTISPF